jgi:GDP/UDP-N,N'-diacetylbacillosamine 2-epimerase (hydrolysing)
MKKICVITGSRSEYGLLKNLILGIKNSKKLKLQLIVTGSHLSREFGSTVKNIISDKFKITKKIKILDRQDDLTNMGKCVARGIEKFSFTFKNIKPDLILILGDRYEILSAAISALFLKIPVAHIHGGERSEGAYDEAIRHAITKFSHLHFVSTKTYRNRVIQLGENKKNVFFTGSIGVDNIKQIKFYSKKILEEKYKVKFFDKNFFIIFHPVTLEDNTQEIHMLEILKALAKFPYYGKFFVYPSADLGGKSIIRLINQFVKNNKNCYQFKSLGQKDYFSFVKNCNIVIGNSSSGVIEVPSLNVGVINIGDRQRGRIKSKVVIDCKPLARDILKNILTILKPSYLKNIKNFKNPYDCNGTTKKIINILENKKNLKSFIKKRFFDLNIAI